MGWTRPVESFYNNTVESEISLEEGLIINRAFQFGCLITGSLASLSRTYLSPCEQFDVQTNGVSFLKRVVIGFVNLARSGMNLV